MKRKGASIVFLNDREEVLLFLRDNDPKIPYPNMWDVPGGHVEDGETPEACIVREMKEEMDLDLRSFELFSEREFSDRIEYTYWAKAHFAIDEIDLREGQRLQWFTRSQVRRTGLAYGFNQILEEFFCRAPQR
jgi:8-oxo-dGTP diphosphatase